MIAIYKYIDIDDGIVKYIGVVTKGTISSRHYNHKSQDIWCSDRMQLQYVELSTKSEAYAYESHFISFYKTYKYYNKDKSDWGLNNYIQPLSDEKWNIFNYPNDHYGIYKVLLRKGDSNSKKLILWLNSLDDGTVFKTVDLYKGTGLDHKQVSKVKEKNYGIRSLFNTMKTDKHGYYIFREELLNYK